MKYSLKTEVWVKAELRRCMANLMTAAILVKGDEERGQVLIRCYRHGQGNIFFQLMRDERDVLVWNKPLGEAYIPDHEANDYQQRQSSYDQDLWIIEVEDPSGLYEPQPI